MKRIVKISLLILVLGVFVWTLWFLYKKSEKPPVVFTTEQAFKTSIVKKTVATGSIVPRKEIEIKPKVSGIIEKIYIKPGDVVKAGQLIAKVKIIPDMLNLNNAATRVDQAKISFENAKMDYDRQKKLFEQEVISKSQFQQFETSFLSAKTEMEAAQSNLELIKDGASKNMGESSNTLIKSTVEGMVLDVPVKEGNSVIESNTFNDGTTIASIADMQSMLFEGKVDESEVGKIKEGMELILTIGAIENQTYKAILEYISPKGVEENGAIQFEIKAAVELSESSFIRAGYSANADIVLDKKDEVLAIHESLLKFSGDTVYVEIETKPQVFERKDIKVGISDGVNIEILEGITESDKIKVQNELVE